MRRPSYLSVRQVVFVVLLVILVNAQLTWWVVFVLRENRARLELERATLMDACRDEVHRIESELRGARAVLLQSATAGGWDQSSAAPAPFGNWTLMEGTRCDSKWSMRGHQLTLSVAVSSGCLRATAHSSWHEQLLNVGSEIEVVDVAPEVSESSTVGLPSVGLPLPFDDLSVRPRPEVWDDLLDGYRRRIVMIVSEGAFFAAMLFMLLGLLVRTLRREADLERRHRNFLSAITHELKSPMASMRLALETVLSGRARGADSERFLGNALRDTERLQDLVQKVLEVTRYDRGGEPLELRSVSLSGVVRDAVCDFARRAEQLGASVEADVVDDVWAEVNEEAFAIVVSNLLENAIKYGEDPASIEVRLDFVGDCANLDVTDNGAGIPMESLPFVFDRFYRGGDELTRTASGTGLGLYLVRQIVRAHRGEVAVKSTGPHGTTVRVTMPARQLKEAVS